MAQNQRHRQHYPFAAIVGQEDLKLCLTLCAIDPTIGGVLIRGEKGTAKSTAARGLAQLLPKITVGYDSESGMVDPYNRLPANVRSESESYKGEDGDGKDHSDGHYKESTNIDTPFVDLPIGATEDRVIGSIDFSATLKSGGKPTFAPGLLAAANRGVLYVDEVNLLPAHLVDILLDAAAMGVNTIQREGMTKTHPANFMLVGTMNREEGELRPQLLDRFGLMVDVAAPEDVVMRSEVVRQRISFERDRVEFRSQWADEEAQMTAKILAAKDRLSQGVVLSDSLLLLISRICIEFKVGSLRADITMYKAAMALAAWEGRVKVEAEDVRRVADWVLAHRRRQEPFQSPNSGPSDDELMDDIMNSSQPPEPPQDPSSSSQNNQNGGQNNEHQQPPPEGTDNGQDSTNNEGSSSSSPGNEKQSSAALHKDSEDTDGQANDGGEMQTFTASRPGQIKQIKLANQQRNVQSSGNGRSNYSTNSNQKTHYVRSIQTNKPTDLDLNATLRAAAPNGLCSTTGQPIIHPENLRKKVYANPTDKLVLFVVDASGSMSARKRMETVKGTVLALLTDAYQRRDRVGVVAFRGPKAEVLLEPTRSVELAERQLARLPTGGRTPLAHALVLAQDVVRRSRRNDEPEQAILLVVLSDGKANVPLPEGCQSGGGGGGGDAWSQTERVAMELANLTVPTLFLDTDSGHVRVGRGKELGELLKADYMLLEDLTSDVLVHTIQQAVG